MGNGISVQVSCDKVLERVGSCFCGQGNYIQNLKENLTALEKAMEDLTAIRDDVLKRVQTEEGKGLERLQQVQVWLKRVEIIQNQVNELFIARTIEIQRLCLYGVCSNNLNSSYSYGRRVFLKLQEVENLKSNGLFELVAEPALRLGLEERPIQQTIVGQETMLERAWNHLMADEVQIMGLYGMGGVGKTTLLTQIHNRFRDTKYGVDIVIWVLVSSDLQIHKIQEDIGEKIGLRGPEWNLKTEDQKAIDILNVLSRKRFVLLLDDIWKKVDLTKIGIPNLTRENGCKVAFTTRSRDVCARMRVHDPMEVQCLAENDAWHLFQQIVGQTTLESHPEIKELARKVSEKCRGLPLALNVIGETMSCKRTVQQWRHAIDALTPYAAEFSGMDDQILPILKYSYDNLKDEQVMSCFQYCALHPEDYSVEKERLIDYWICEGFIEGHKDRERAVNQGYEIIGTLVHACLLLEEGKGNSCIKMHDVVREMALWIASDLGKHKERCIVKAGVGLHEIPPMADWSAVRRVSLMNNEIKRICGRPNCSELTTLFLQENKALVHISGDFFRFMPKLVVLDLSKNHNLDKLPEQISELVSLRYLDLSHTNIEGLPSCLQKLKTLTHLNLEGMRRLGSIVGISKLSSLRALRLLKSYFTLDSVSVKELHLLKHLEVLTMNIWSNPVLEQMICPRRLVNCIEEVNIGYLIHEEDRTLLLPIMNGLRMLTIQNCTMSEIKIEKISWNISPTIPCFSNLSKVRIYICLGLKDLTWLLFAPNLTSLRVESSLQLEDIINKEESARFIEGQMQSTVPFRKLERLELCALPMLKSVYWSALPFPCLREIYVVMCPNLRKLPLNSESVVVGEKLKIHYKEKNWIEGIEWEDEATRLLYLPSSKQVFGYSHN